MRRPLVVLAAAGLLVAAAACEPEPSSPSPADLAKVDFTPDATITVDDDGFTPAVVPVDPGDVIELRNAGSEPHSATHTDRFDTGLIAPGQSTTIVLTTPGKVTVTDTADPDHTARIDVSTGGQ